MTDKIETPKPKKMRTPSHSTVVVRAFAKVQRLRDDIDRRDAKEKKNGMIHANLMVKLRNELKDAEDAFNALTKDAGDDN